MSPCDTDLHSLFSQGPSPVCVFVLFPWGMSMSLRRPVSRGRGCHCGGVTDVRVTRWFQVHSCSYSIYINPVRLLHVLLLGRLHFSYMFQTPVLYCLPLSHCGSFLLLSLPFISPEVGSKQVSVVDEA